MRSRRDVLTTVNGLRRLGERLGLRVQARTSRPSVRSTRNSREEPATAGSSRWEALACALSIRPRGRCGRDNHPTLGSLMRTG